MTGHRRESFDGGLERIARAMARIAARPDVAIVFPVHPNPNVRRAIESLRRHDNILLIEPVDYPELVYLLKRCHFVVTDSGGIQEEAPSFGKPVLVTRETTERPEAMEQGLARLVGTDERLLFEAMSELLDDPEAYRRMSRVANPYGDGQASRRVADRLASPRTRRQIGPPSPPLLTRPHRERSSRRAAGSPIPLSPGRARQRQPRSRPRFQATTATITISAVSRLTRGMVSSADSSASTGATHWRPSSETGYSEAASLFTDPSRLRSNTLGGRRGPCDPAPSSVAMLADGAAIGVPEPSKIRPLFFSSQYRF